MIIFTIIGVVVVACLLISYFNSKTLSYEQKTTVLGLVLKAHASTGIAEYSAALSYMDRALNIDPYNEDLRAMKKMVIQAANTRKKTSDTFITVITENIIKKYRL